MVTAVIMGILVSLVLPLTLVVWVAYLFINKNKNNMQSEQKTKALDVFLYLGIAISLVMSVVNFLQVIFTAIDKKFVDVLNPAEYYDIYSSDVRMAIASLVVMFPVYLGLSWYVSRDISKFLYKRDLLIRKVMVYLTLFVTVCSLIGTLVSVIYTYLGGELSVRFELKALSVFVVSLSLFAYYLYSMKRDYTKKSYIPVALGVISSIVVISSLVWSIRIIGTPSEMRSKRIDSTRLSDISRIQQEILNRLNSTDKMPASLSELNNAFQGYAVPTDPVTKVAYGYNVLQQPTFSAESTNGSKKLIKPAIFELCATFDIARNVDERGMPVAPVPTKVGMGGIGLSSEDSMYSAQNYYYEGDNSPFWNHGVGETCFKRIISADMYYGK